MSVLTQVKAYAKHRAAKLGREFTQAPWYMKAVIAVTVFPVIPTASAATAAVAGPELAMDFGTALVELTVVTIEWSWYAACEYFNTCSNYFS